MDDGAQAQAYVSALQWVEWRRKRALKLEANAVLKVLNPNNKQKISNLSR